MSAGRGAIAPRPAPDRAAILRAVDSAVVRESVKGSHSRTDSQGSQTSCKPLLRLKLVPQGLELGSRYQSW